MNLEFFTKIANLITQCIKEATLDAVSKPLIDALKGSTRIGIRQFDIPRPQQTEQLQSPSPVSQTANETANEVANQQKSMDERKNQQIQDAGIVGGGAAAAATESAIGSGAGGSS